MAQTNQTELKQFEELNDYLTQKKTQTSKQLRRLRRIVRSLYIY